MSCIFISYSHQDSDYAYRLAESLEQASFEVWIDNRIDYGDTWPHEIQEHVDSCAAFVVVMTPRSYQSRWVQNELTRAQRKAKPVFPLLLEGDAWMSVEATQYVDVRDRNLPPPNFYERVARIVPKRSPESTVAPGDVPVAGGPSIDDVPVKKGQPMHGPTQDTQLAGEDRKLANWRLWLLIALTIVIVIAVAILALQVVKERVAIQAIENQTYVPADAPTYAWIGYKDAGAETALFIVNPADGEAYWALPGEAWVPAAEVKDAGTPDANGFPTTVGDYTRIAPNEKPFFVSENQGTTYGTKEQGVQVTSASTAEQVKQKYIYLPEYDGFVDAQTDTLYTNIDGIYTATDGSTLSPGHK